MTTQRIIQLSPAHHYAVAAVRCSLTYDEYVKVARRADLMVLAEDTYNRITKVVRAEHSGPLSYQLEYIRRLNDRIQMATRCVGKLGISTVGVALRLLHTSATYRRTRSKQPRTVRVISRRT